MLIPCKDFKIFLPLLWGGEQGRERRTEEDLKCFFLGSLGGSA